MLKQVYGLTVQLNDWPIATEPDKWMAEIPALPSCRAWGDTPEETIEIISDLAVHFMEDEGYGEGADKGRTYRLSKTGGSRTAPYQTGCTIRRISPNPPALLPLCGGPGSEPSSGSGRCVEASTVVMYSGVPSATTCPPLSAGPGPMSIIQSAFLIMSRWCSMRIIELPASTSRCSTFSSEAQSEKERPVVGSSSR